MLLHVNPNGKNENDGLTTDAPLADIQSAYDKLAKSYRAGTLDGPGAILLQAGNYVLSKPLHFTSDFPVEIRAEVPGSVTVSGGKTLQGWEETTVNGKKAWKTTLAQFDGNLPFIYLDGKLATPARWPKTDMSRVQDIRSGYTTLCDDCDTFHLSKGDFNPAWHDIHNIHIHMFHLWVDEWFTVQDYDDETCCITTAQSIRYVAGKNTEVVFHNVKEALSEPGEYYFDRNTRELLLINGKETAPEDAVLPCRDALVRFDGDAKWITLSGIVFQYSGTHLPQFKETYDIRERGLSPLANTSFPVRNEYPKPFLSSSQGASHIPGAIAFDHASDCVIRDCTVRCVSQYAIQVGRAAKNLFFSNNHLHELGGGGFMVNGATYGACQSDKSLQVSHITFQGNHIHDGGLLYASSIGILLQHASACLVEDNHIHDLFYSGISAGWVWGYAPSMTCDIRIHRNHVHDLGKGLLSDMGGVYMLGRQPGSHVWENVVHDIVNRYYGGWGLYTDEGSSHIVMEKNLVYDCACEGFHQHYGSENIIRYNVFAFNKRGGMIVSREYFQGYSCPGEAYANNATLMGNVIVTDGQAVLRVTVPRLYDDGRVISDCNIAFDASAGTDVRWGEFTDAKAVPPTVFYKSLKEWQATGQDCHSSVADPGFKNLKKRDFHLKKTSILRHTPFDFLEDILK